MSETAVSITRFQSNRQAELGGVWVTAEAGLRLCVARMNNPKYVAKLRELTLPYQEQLRQATKRYRKDGEKRADKKDDLAPELLEELMMQAASETILLDWQNLAEPDPEDPSKLVPVPYSSEKALEYFKKYRDFWLMVLEISNDEALYRESTLEDSKGN